MFKLFLVPFALFLEQVKAEDYAKAAASTLSKDARASVEVSMFFFLRRRLGCMIFAPVGMEDCVWPSSRRRVCVSAPPRRRFCCGVCCYFVAGHLVSSLYICGVYLF